MAKFLYTDFQKTGFEYAVNDEGKVFYREKYLCPKYKAYKKTSWKPVEDDKKASVFQALPASIRQGFNYITFLYRKRNDLLRLP